MSTCNCGYTKIALLKWEYISVTEADLHGLVCMKIRSFVCVALESKFSGFLGSNSFLLEQRTTNVLYTDVLCILLFQWKKNLCLH